jgi:exopolysaccharide biosynthesis WecB/TagA/CpsF family protein
MTNSATPSAHHPARPRQLSRDTLLLLGDLLPLFDFAAVLLAAWLGTLLFGSWFAPDASSAALFRDGARAALAAAVLAPLILCERGLSGFVSGGQTAALVRCFAVRFAMFAGVVAAIGLASRSLDSLPRAWLALWFAGSLLITALVRIGLVGTLRRLERNGRLSETVAVVGAGPLADCLIERLRQARGRRIEILGVFDDRTRRAGGEHAPAGRTDDLIELGQTRSIDWILLALPAAAESRRHDLVQRLKALAVPLGLAPEAVGLDGRAIRYLGDGLPVTLLAERAATRWDAAVAAAGTVLPPWVITLLGLPLAALRLLVAAVRAARQPPAALEVPRAKVTLPLDAYDLESFAAAAARFGQDRFGYAVNPNADHVIRLHREPSFRALYADADYVLLDSRFLSHLLRCTGAARLPVCAGSDLAATLLEQASAPDDRLVLVGGSSAQAAHLARRYGLKHLAHFAPAMGFIHEPRAVEECLRFIEAHSPFRYCLLAVGAPQQEAVAQALKARGTARGLALCVGAAIDFLTGAERRAPRWMQQAGLEWLFRLLRAPRRMAGRYLVRGLQIFWLLRRTAIVPRAAALPPARLIALAAAALPPVQCDTAQTLQQAGPMLRSHLSGRKAGPMADHSACQRDFANAVDRDRPPSLAVDFRRAPGLAKLQGQESRRLSQTQPL